MVATSIAMCGVPVKLKHERGWVGYFIASLGACDFWLDQATDASTIKLLRQARKSQKSAIARTSLFHSHHQKCSVSKAMDVTQRLMYNHPEQTNYYQGRLKLRAALAVV